jgi:hypothetical protein
MKAPPRCCATGGVTIDDARAIEASTSAASARDARPTNSQRRGSPAITNDPLCHAEPRDRPDRLRRGRGTCRPSSTSPEGDGDDRASRWRASEPGSSSLTKPSIAVDIATSATRSRTWTTTQGSTQCATPRTRTAPWVLGRRLQRRDVAVGGDSAVHATFDPYDDWPLLRRAGRPGCRSPTTSAPPAVSLSVGLRGCVPRSVSTTSSEAPLPV